MPPILEFNDYNIAWIAPLSIEAIAARCMMDKLHEGSFRSDPGDDYQYIPGEINGHNIIIATFPSGTTYGGNSAAALAAQVRKCFTKLWFGLLVGIAAGIPDFSEVPPLDIRLGDVLVSLPDQERAGILQYDFGKQTSHGFENCSRPAMPASILRSTLGNMRDDIFGEEVFLNHLELGHLNAPEQEKFQRIKSKFEYPGQDQDHLYETVDQQDKVVERKKREEKKRTIVYYGKIGSGNTLMKSSHERDQLRKKYGFIGLEMEAHGTVDVIPVGHIRGVCDYADKFKSNDWHGYAAMVAAAWWRRPPLFSPASLAASPRASREDLRKEILEKEKQTY